MEIINRKETRIEKGTLLDMALSSGSKIEITDVSSAIKSITRSGTTFTYTTLGGSTGTFTQQDNNTTYTAGTGISISSNKITNTGVTSVNGSTGAVTISAGTATALSNFVIGGWLSGSGCVCSGGSLNNYVVTLPSGGTWRYMAFRETIGAYGTKSGGSTINLMINDSTHNIIAIRIA